MGYREDLIAARDRYAAELAAQQPPPDYSWNEYEEFLCTQIEKLQRLIAEYDAAGAVDPDAGEIVSAGYT